MIICLTAFIKGWGQKRLTMYPIENYKIKPYDGGKHDELESKASKEYRHSWNLTKREIKIYDSYSEESKVR